MKAEARTAYHGLALVEAQAVDLHDAGVALDLCELDHRPRRAPDEPRRHHRPHDQSNVGTTIRDGVEELDRTGGVAEPVA
jgi:hypothetical protein